MSCGGYLVLNVPPRYDSTMQEKFRQASMHPALLIAQLQPGTIATLTFAHKIYVSKPTICYGFNFVEGEQIAIGYAFNSNARLRQRMISAIWHPEISAQSFGLYTIGGGWRDMT